MSKARAFLESHGWHLWSRRKHGMYIKERWYHPDNGAETCNQEEAVRQQRRKNKDKKSAEKAELGKQFLYD